MTGPEPTTAPRHPQIELELLADVAADRVTSDEEGTVWLDLGGGERANISLPVWEMEREPRRWVHQLDGETLWRLTFRGRDILQGRAS